MTRCIAGGTASLALLTGTPRFACAADECARVIASPELSPGWAAAAGELARQLAALPSSDCRPLTLSIEPGPPTDGDVRVVATADDGRRAERRVAQPSMLVPVALGLVISIPAPPPAPPAAAPAPVPPAPPSTVSPPSVPPAPATSAHAVELWLGLAAGSRYGVPSAVTMFDLEARADLRIDRLLLFASFRNVPIGFVASEGSDADAYRESSIAFGVGRAFALGSCWLDVAVAPTLVTMRLGRDGPQHLRADDVEFRVGASARLNVPLTPAWRFTITADTDVIPDALRSAIQVDTLPAFPAWTSGLRVGASGAVL